MNRAQDTARKIIVALDVEEKEEALSLVKELPKAEIFKVGLRLFTAQGPSLLQEIHNFKKKIFLDLKFHDIPNTVEGAVAAAVNHGVHMLTLHSSGGKEMMAKAVEAARKKGKKREARPLLLAVTILTSLKDDQLKDIGMTASPKGQVLRLAKLAREAGMDGVVCSPQEIEFIKEGLGRDLLVVTPGIRPSWAAAQDQKRIMSPSLALKKGADYLVIGRPIIKDSSPARAFLKICEELDSAVNSSHSKNTT
ncbi:MAG: orotidine-5'-phosphate decarboxylase [Candidatus Aminicenantes bacterium]